MIGYYIHHHGAGHLVRARSICAELSEPVTALSSLPLADSRPFHATVTLARDDRGAPARDPTASGCLHWAPRADDGLRDRMSAISAWIDAARPTAMVVDVSVEVALLARLHGIPVITMALPGVRTDPPHRMVHEFADSIIATWPRRLYEPDWLRPHRAKTCYTGGISRFDGRPRTESDRHREPNVVVLGGAGGTDFTPADVGSCARSDLRFVWHTVGLDGWQDDPWPRLRTADIVVAHAGQGSVADIAAAAKPAVLIPSRRPFDEQHATAATLAHAGLAITTDTWPTERQWPELLTRALDIDTRRWRQWRTAGAAARAARAIERIAHGASR
ncbi:glycosyltransferase [Nocardia takedensis]